VAKVRCDFQCVDMHAKWRENNARWQR
jgi:hypothetical protein